MRLNLLHLEDRSNAGSLLALDSLPAFADWNVPAPPSPRTDLASWLGDDFHGAIAFQSDEPRFVTIDESSPRATRRIEPDDSAFRRLPDDERFVWAIQTFMARIAQTTGPTGSPSNAGVDGPPALEPRDVGFVSIAPAALSGPTSDAAQIFTDRSTRGLAADEPATWIAADNDYIYRDDPVTFYVETDLDPVPSYSSVEWDFDYAPGDFQPDPIASGLFATASFDSDGTQIVAVRLSENPTTQQIVTLDVDIHHPPPELTVPADFTIPEWNSKTLTLTATTDLAIANVEWWVSYEFDEYEQIPNFADLEEDYDFQEPGKYGFWVAVTDENGEVAEAMFDVTVTNASPDGYAFYKDKNGGTNAPVDEGDTVTFVVTELDRELDLENTESLTVEVDWYGNGEWDIVDDGDWSLDVSAKTVTFDTPYEDNPDGGTIWHAKVRVFDDFGSYTEDAVDVQVRNVAPAGEISAGQHIASLASSGQEVWAVYADTQLMIVPPGTAAAQNAQASTMSLAFDPSYADVETMEFHWKINGVDLFVAGGKYDNHAITLEKYEAGDVHDVEVYLRDKDGAESPRYTFKAAVFPSYPIVQHPYIGLPAFDPDAPSTGEFTATPTGQLTAPGMGYGTYGKAVYGTFLPDGATDDGYQRFSEWPAVIVKQQDGLDANFVFDQASKNFAAANGADIVYRFSVDVRTAEGAPSGGAPLPGNKYIENATGHLVVDPVGNDRVIIATVIPEMRVNGAVFRTAGPHQIIVHTPVSENVSTWDQIYDLYKIVRDLAPQFGQAVVDLFATMASGGFESIVSNLQTGIAGAGEQFIQDFKTTAKQAFFQWLGGTSTIANIANYNFANLDDIKAFLLQYAGLTWDNVQSILVQELGAGNVAAVGQVHALFAANNIDVSDPKSLITFLQQADLGDIAGQLVDKALGKIEEEVKRAVPLFFATFIPGAGTARALYKGLNWLLQNRNELGEVFTRIVDSLSALSSGTPAAFQSQLLAAMNQSVGVFIPLLAAQFGLDKLPNVPLSETLAA